MTPERCINIRASFSAYLDGAVSGYEMQDISRHLYGNETYDNEEGRAGCAPCAGEFAAWRTTQDVLAALRPAKPPADLSLRLRLAISRENARRSFRIRDRLLLAWQNAVRPLVVQISAGLAGSVALVGCSMLLLGLVAPRQAVLANDEPLGAITAPHYLYSVASPGTIVTSHDTAVIVEAEVDNTGRVYDYTIVSGPQDYAVQIQVANLLLGSVFKPASVFGLPVRSHVVVTYAGISVRA